MRFLILKININDDEKRTKAEGESKSKRNIGDKEKNLPLTGIVDSCMREAPSRAPIPQNHLFVQDQLRTEDTLDSNITID